MSSREAQTGKKRFESHYVRVTLKAMGLRTITKGVSVDTKEKRSKREELECVEVEKIG